MLVLPLGEETFPSRLEAFLLTDKLNVGRIGWASRGADQCELI
jgi:hypothetical protein